MKRILFLSFLLLMLTIVGCSNDEDATNQKESTDTGEKPETEDSVDVDEKQDDVEVTLPASLVEELKEDEEIEEITEEAKEDGMKEVTENDDGSLTYKMSKSKHEEIMKEIEGDLIETIDEVIEDEDYDSIKDIEANKPYTAFNVIVDKQMFEDSLDGISILAVVFHSMFYQLFDGVDPDDYEAVFTFENEDTNEVFDEVVYPDAFEE